MQKFLTTLLAFVFFATLSQVGIAQQVSAPKTPSDVIQPAEGILMSPGYAKMVARSAYVWGWPMVNMLNRKAAITKAPHPGLLNGVLPAAPRGEIGMLHDYIEPSEHFVTCPNQDVVYGLGFFSLDEEPVIVQVPDFGDRFWVYALYDVKRRKGDKPHYFIIPRTFWDVREVERWIRDRVVWRFAPARLPIQMGDRGRPKRGELRVLFSLRRDSLE